MFRRKNPLFRSGMEPRCAYCQRAVPRYDPLRRVPPKPATLRSSFTDADFSLEDD